MKREVKFCRRDLLKAALAITALPLLSTKGVAAQKEIPYRLLGKTGEKVSLIGLGGHHIGRQANPEESIRIIRTALDNGINFLDNSWDYNEGQSEIRMGKALKDGYRSKAFLMTKIDGQTEKSAQEQLDESLKRLQTDYIDLVQFHEIIRPTDPDRIFAQDGAADALMRAKQDGKIRYIGFTGHKHPDIHLKMLDVGKQKGFSFDTVQMPLNVMDAHYESFEKRVLPRLVEEKIGVLGMKSLGEGYILKTGAATPQECLHYVMSLPVSVVITGCDSMKILDQAISIGRNFQPLNETAMNRILEKTKALAQKGEHELYKTSEHFDATARHPEWLG